MSDTFRSGFVALVGRPNVGKSTLLNRLVGQKVSITSRRPQTTRHRILGICTEAETQWIFVDTPGLHGEQANSMNRYMNRAARGSLTGVDCVVMLITASGWQAEDELVVDALLSQDLPRVLAINKIDRLAQREALLPLIQESSKRLSFAAIVPLSARNGDGVEDLKSAVRPFLPEQEAHFPAEQVCDRSERFLAAELVREQVFQGFAQEIPYATAVEITQFDESSKVLRIEAVLWVEKDGQKAILIGKGGSRLKEIGRRARLGMEAAFGRKVHLGLWVKVRGGWADDLRSLQSLGYTEDS